jgi:hypothetical protein
LPGLHAGGCASPFSDSQAGEELLQSIHKREKTGCRPIPEPPKKDSARPSASSTPRRIIAAYPATDAPIDLAAKCFILLSLVLDYGLPLRLL